MSHAFCRFSGPCHFRESNRGLPYRQRNCERVRGKYMFCAFLEAADYFFVAEPFGGAAGIATAGGGSGANNFFAESGSLSALATKSANCHICVSFNMPLKVGIPVNRMPFFTFQ